MVCSELVRLIGRDVGTEFSKDRDAGDLVLICFTNFHEKAWTWSPAKLCFEKTERLISSLQVLAELA